MEGKRKYIQISLFLKYYLLYTTTSSEVPMLVNSEMLVWEGININGPIVQYLYSLQILILYILNRISLGYYYWCVVFATLLAPGNCYVGNSTYNLQSKKRWVFLWHHLAKNQKIVLYHVRSKTKNTLLKAMFLKSPNPIQM